MILLHFFALVAAALDIAPSPPAPQPPAPPPAAETTPSSGDFVIFRSIGPSKLRYPSGRRLPSNARLVLRAGDSVTIVQDDRFARTFRGPGLFAIRMMDLQTTAGASAQARGVLGGIRGSAGDAADPALSRFIICPNDRRCPR